MRVKVINKGSKDKRGDYEQIIFVHVTPEEAVSLCRSLMEQLESKNSNKNRLESYTKDGEYFSVGVDFTGERS